MFEGEDIDNLDEEPLEEESGNGRFMLIVSILVGLILLSIACIGFYYIRVVSPRNGQNLVAEQTKVAQDVQIQQGLTQNAVSNALSQVPLATATITNTPVIQVATTAPPTVNTPDPLTVTVAAALTQAVIAQLTVTGLPTTTALPTSGFADEAGLPGLVIITFALVLVILLARRLRTSPGSH